MSHGQDLLDEVIALSLEVVAAADESSPSTPALLERRDAALRRLVQEARRNRSKPLLRAALEDGHFLAAELGARREQSRQEIEDIGTASRMLSAYSNRRAPARIDTVG